MAFIELLDESFSNSYRFHWLISLLNAIYSRHPLKEVEKGGTGKDFSIE